MSSRFNGYGLLDSEIVEKTMAIAEKIENEKKNVEPDNETIAKLMYQQLMTGMGLFSNNNRFNKNYL